MMSHFWTADDPPAARQAQLEDWIDDLGEFHPSIVAEACRMWRRANVKRPTPHDIRDLCRAELEYRKPIPEAAEPTATEIADAQERQSAWKWRWRVAAAYRWMQQCGTTMPAGLTDFAPIVKELVSYFERRQTPPQEFFDRLHPQEEKLRRELGGSARESMRP